MVAASYERVTVWGRARRTAWATEPVGTRAGIVPQLAQGPNGLNG